MTVHAFALVPSVELPTCPDTLEGAGVAVQDAAVTFAAAVSEARTVHEIIALRRRVEALIHVLTAVSDRAGERADYLSQTAEPDHEGRCVECHAPAGELCHWSCSIPDRTGRIFTSETPDAHLGATEAL